jgi:16S rRNA (guanine966-N2)-methyltransferase
MDRVRSALFSILSLFDLENINVADLFAGTGTLGIEALSRGVGHVDFVEQMAVQCRDIRSNLLAANLLNKATIHQMPVTKALDSLTAPYDLVLMDPPYIQPFPLDVLGKLQERSLIHEDSLIVVGHATRVDSPKQCGGFVRWQDRRYGDSSIAFYLSSGRELM